MLLKNNMELISEPCGTYPKLTKTADFFPRSMWVLSLHSGYLFRDFPEPEALPALADYLNDIAAK
jgi:hypothetical protein